MIKKLIILAAGKGTRLKPITDELPKCLTIVGNKSILEWQIDVARKAGIQEIIVVGGYKAEKIDCNDINLIVNNSYETSNMVESLRCAQTHFNEGFILSYGDILYEEYILKDMMDLEHDITIASDMKWRQYWSKRFDDPLTDAETFKFSEDNCVSQIGGKANNYNEIDSQYIGLLSFSKNGSSILKNWFCNSYTNRNMYMTDMLTSLIESGQVIKAHRINRGWLEIDNLRDLEVAETNLTINNTGSIEVIL